MNAEELKKAREICNRATEGEWHCKSIEDDMSGVIDNYVDSRFDDGICCGVSNPYDAEFIAFARTALPACLDHIEGLQKEKLNTENTITQLRAENECLRRRLSYLRSQESEPPSKHNDDVEALARHFSERGKRYGY